MCKFLVLDVCGLGGAMPPADALLVVSEDVLSAARLATAYGGTLNAKPFGRTGVCWIAESVEVGGDGNPVVGVLVVQSFG